MKEASSSASEQGGQAARIGAARVGRRLRSSRRSIEFLRAFARALRDPATYDLRSNAGLWLGFVLALPIPVLALLSSAPPWIVDVALVAPLAWSVIVGAAAQVGIAGSSRLRQMRLDTSNRQRIHEEACLDLQDVVEDQRRRESSGGAPGRCQPLLARFAIVARASEGLPVSLSRGQLAQASCGKPEGSRSANDDRR